MYYSKLQSGVSYSTLQSGVYYSTLQSGVNYSKIQPGVYYSTLQPGVYYNTFQVLVDATSVQGRLLTYLIPVTGAALLLNLPKVERNLHLHL